MKYIILVIMTALSFSGCEIRSNDIELKINVIFSDGVTCRTYLADKFEIALFDSNQKRMKPKTFSCNADITTFSIFVPKEKYYIIVSLKDAAGNIKSYGTGFTDATLSDIDVDIEMNEYQGGVTFEWGTEFCNRYDVGLLKFTLLHEGENVSSIIWGKEVEINEHEMLCNSGYLEVVNIPSGMYTAMVKAYRNNTSKRERIRFDVDDFMLTAGHQTPLKIDNYKEIVVSDIIVEWDFDSRSIEGCSATDIQKIVAEISTGSFDEAIERICSDTERKLNFYDLPAGEYEITVKGVDSSANVIFSGSKSERVEVGKIGKDSIIYQVYIVEE